MKITKTENVGEISSKRTLHFSDVGMTLEDIVYLTNNAFGGEGLYELEGWGDVGYKGVGATYQFGSQPLYIGEVDGFKYYCESSDHFGECGWHEAKEYCESLGNGWEMPNRVVSLLMYGNKEVRKTLKEDAYYWTSEENSSTSAWLQHSPSGRQYTSSKTYPDNSYVRPVLKIKV